MGFRGRDIKCRMAKNAEGAVVGDLAERCGYDFKGWDIDWSDIEPFWVVAEVFGVMVGAVQVLPGKPVGRIEILCIEPEIQGMERALVVRTLTDFGQLVLRESGSQAAAGIIPFKMKSYKRVAKRRGWLVLVSGNLMFRRVTP